MKRKVKRPAVSLPSRSSVRAMESPAELWAERKARLAELKEERARLWAERLWAERHPLPVAEGEAS